MALIRAKVATYSATFNLIAPYVYFDYYLVSVSRHTSLLEAEDL
jgi:hypothetical protein